MKGKSLMSGARQPRKPHLKNHPRRGKSMGKRRGKRY